MKRKRTRKNEKEQARKTKGKPDAAKVTRKEERRGLETMEQLYTNAYTNIYIRIYIYI